MEQTRDEESRLAVQEVAMGVDDVPIRYVQRKHDRPAITAAMPAPLPFIDLSRLSLSDGGNEEAAKLRSALKSWGLFLVTDHGIETSLMEELLNVSREFFRQPLDEKQKYSNLIDGKHFQPEGYGTDNVKTKGQILDWSDRLHLQVEPEDERNLALWPKHPNSFRDILHEFTIKSKKVAENVYRVMAKLLELKEDYFINQFSNKAHTHVRFSYYPRCQRPDLVFGLKSHSDGPALTVLLLDKDVGGLQVLRDGVWYDVPTIPHALLINIGDSMEIMSNGIFKSPVHRVVTNPEKERISVAMFYATDPEKEIEPAAELLDEKRPALYRKVKTKDYIAGVYEHFSRGTRVIDSVKI